MAELLFLGILKLFIAEIVVLLMNKIHRSLHELTIFNRICSLLSLDSYGF